MKYTLDFAESDSKLISYNQDIDISSSTAFGVLNKLDNEILSAVIINNFKTRRMINFAESALAVEFEVQSDRKFTQHSSLDSNIDSISTYTNENKDVEINNLNNIKGNRVSFWESLPQTLSVKNIPNIDSNNPSSSSSDNSIKQLQRDIQRDQMLINGQLLIGADVGLEGTMEVLGKTIDKLLEECDNHSLEHLASIQPSLKQNFCYDILHTACRTNSGGVSYSGLQVVLSQNKNGSKNSNDKNKADKNSPDDEDKNKLSSHDKSKENRFNTIGNYNDNISNNSNNDFGNDGEEDILSKYIIVPQSTLAPPLRIRLSVCKFGIDDDVISADTGRDSVNKTTNVPSSSSYGSSFMSLFRKRVVVANKKKAATTPNNKNKNNSNKNKIVTLTPKEEGILQQHTLKSTSSLSVAQVQQAAPSTSSSVNIGDGISGKTSVSNVVSINSGGNSDSQDSRIPAVTTTTTVLPSVLSINNNKSLLSKPLLSSLPLSTSLIKNNSGYISSNTDTTIYSWGIRCSIDCITIFSLKPIDGGYDSSRRIEGLINSSSANSNNSNNNNNNNNAVDSSGNNRSSDDHNRNLQATYHNSVVLPLNIVSKKLITNNAPVTTAIFNANTNATSTQSKNNIILPACGHIVNNGQVQVSIYNATDNNNSI